MKMNREQASHKVQMNRLLTEILDDKELAVSVFFKGGTCAKLLGLLDRFSVDLDFDLSKKVDKKSLRKKLYKIFKQLDLEIKDESAGALQFFLRYPTPEETSLRNTVKLEILDKVYKTNEYKPRYISEIGRTAICQTIETMFSHKLIAPIDRYESRKKIAGRDLYDIHHFFLQGYSYNPEIIKERRGVSLLDHLRELEEFVEKKVTIKIIEEDINTLLDYEKFSKIRKHLKPELLDFIRNEVSNTENYSKKQGSGVDTNHFTFGGSTSDNKENI